MQWNSTPTQESIFSFANNINTHEGGSPPLRLPLRADAARSTPTRASRACSRRRTTSLSGEDIREGLTAVISAKLADPQFEGQTKTKLGNPGMAGFVESVVNARPRRVPRGEPGRRQAHHHARPCDAARARDAARKARDLTRASPRWRTPRPARQARRLLGQGPRAGRALRRRGRLRRRLRPSRAATARRRPSCRCAARSSTSRRRASTRCSQNTEIQALITAIGTGVREEFDLENARYHKIILMTDADVDGAHIRTLVLTLLFREMPRADRARATSTSPSRRSTSSSRARNERYIEKESELEEILLRDKFERFEITDRARPARSSSPRRAGRRSPGCSSSTRAGRSRCAPSTGTTSSTFLEESLILDEGIADADALERAPARRRRRSASPGRPRSLDAATRRARRRAPSSARPASPGRTASRRALLRRRRSTAASCASTRQLVELAGTPPFTVDARRQRRDEALSFEELRAARAPSSPARASQLQRFKGLGEMNADQLAETTMDPGARTLAQVTMEDAVAGRPRLLDAHGRQGRAAARVHRGQRPPRRPTSTSDREGERRWPSSMLSGGNIEPRALEDEMRTAYLDYAMSRDRRARAARRPRRPQARPPPRALRR